MNIRRLLAHSLLIALPSLGATAWAQNAAAPIPQTLEEANAQRARATQMRDTAEENFIAEQQACYAKFLVNSCLDEARKRHTDALIEARKLDAPAREFQREAHRAEVEAKAAQRAAEAPQREAEQKEQAENYRAEEAAKAAERERKIAAKAQQAAEGRQKAAAEQASRQAKLAKRAREDAERTARKAEEAKKAANQDAPK